MSTLFFKVGLVYGENENCFVKGKDNKAFCTPKTDGVDEVLAHDGGNIIFIDTILTGKRNATT